MLAVQASVALDNLLEEITIIWGSVDGRQRLMIVSILTRLIIICLKSFWFLLLWNIFLREFPQHLEYINWNIEWNLNWCSLVLWLIIVAHFIIFPYWAQEAIIYNFDICRMTLSLRLHLVCDSLSGVGQHYRIGQIVREGTITIILIVILCIRHNLRLLICKPVLNRNI